MRNPHKQRGRGSSRGVVQSIRKREEVCVCVCACVRVRVLAWEMYVCVSETSYQRQGKDRHCGGVKLSVASLMETWHELNMRPSLLFLSFEGAVSIITTSIPLPRASVPLKYLKKVQVGWGGGWVAVIVMGRLREAFKAGHCVCVFKCAWQTGCWYQTYHFDMVSWKRSVNDKVWWQQSLVLGLSPGYLTTQWRRLS